VNTSRDRDQSIERLLRQAASHGHATDACLDAETIAAWIDGGLSGAALEMAESHAADCARCQALLGTLTRIGEPVPSRAAAGRRAWLTWLVPLTAAAAALVVWIAVPRDAGPGAPPQADLSRQSAEPRARASGPAMGQTRDAGAGGPDAAAKTNTEAPARATPAAEAKKETGGLQAPPRALEELRKDTERREADAAALKPDASGRVGASVSAAAVPSVPQVAAAEPSLESRNRVVARPAARAAFAPGIEVVSPDPSIRWRLAGTAVERSTDGGANWETQPTETGAPLTAGAAPSASVCWVVGREGVVLLSIDGRTWRRVPFPEISDLTAVRATDARTASVTTSDGRRFGTTDGGATWAR
jgi:hypothetical protein